MTFKKHIYQWHRKLAIITAIPVLLWSLSGLLHPMMSHWFKPTIAKRFLPPTPIPHDLALLPPAEALSSHQKIHQFSLIELKDQWTYLATTPDQNQYFHNATTGELIEDGANLYAEQLARAYLADTASPLIRIQKIEEFSGSYSYINRLLPVYRVELDRADQLEVVVDLRTGRLATFDDAFRRNASIAFHWLHRWGFLGERHSLLRVSAITLVSFLSLITGLFGILNLYILRKKRPAELSNRSTSRKINTRRRLHRFFGMITIPFYLMFSLSGLYHIAVKYIPDHSTSWQSQQACDPTTLTKPISSALREAQGQVTSLSLAELEGQWYYRITSNSLPAPNAPANKKPTKKSWRTKAPPTTQLISAQQDQTTQREDKEFAIALALEFSGYSAGDIEKTELITEFRKDYGFIFKRLPVWRVHFKDREYWHYTVDTSDAHMAMRMKPSQLIETLSFINLHKLHLFDPLHPTLRHSVGAVAVGCLSLLILFGLAILYKGKKQSGKHNAR